MFAAACIGQPHAASCNIVDSNLQFSYGIADFERASTLTPVLRESPCSQTPNTRPTALDPSLACRIHKRFTDVPLSSKVPLVILHFVWAQTQCTGTQTHWSSSPQTHSPTACKKCRNVTPLNFLSSRLLDSFCFKHSATHVVDKSILCQAIFVW